MGRWIFWGLFLAGAGVFLWYAIDAGSVEPPPYVQLLDPTEPEPKTPAGPALAVSGVAPLQTEAARVGNARIRGVVLDPTGAAMSGVTVVASPLPRAVRGGSLQNRRNAEKHFAPPTPLAEPAGRTTTDPLGAFELTGLENGRRYHVRAEVAPPLVSSSQSWNASTQRGWVLRLVVEKGSPLRVRVVDAEGKGIQAWVKAQKWDNRLARAWLQAPWSLPDTQTRPDGRLRIPVVPDQPLLFHVQVPGRGSRTNLLVEAPTDQEVELRFEEASGATVEGKVTSTTGEVVVGAKIAVTTYPVPTPQKASYTMRAAVTDENGMYKVERLPPGRIQGLSVVAEGYIVPPPLGAGTPVQKETATRLDIVLAKGGTITGHILDGTGQPLAGAEVQATRSGSGYGGWNQPLAEAVSAADGSFQLSDVGLGAGILYARLPGYYQPKLDEGASSPYPWMRMQPGVAYELDVEGATLEKTVVLKVGSPVRGTVVGPEGEAIQGATLTLHPAQGGYSYAFSRPGGVTAISDEEGQFVFEGIEPDTSYNINGRTETLIAKQTKVTVPATGEAEPVEVVMEATGAIRGLVLQEDGTAATGATVYCNGHNTSVIADGDGVFSFEGVKPGSWRVQVWGMNPVPPDAMKTIKVEAGETTEDVELTLPALLTISGTVVDEEGQPLAGIGVSASLVQKSRNRRRRVNASATSRPDGTFEIRGLVEGEYNVYGANLTGGGKNQAGTTGLELEWRPPKLETVEGRVVDADGRPVARGSLRVWTGTQGKRNRQYNASITSGRFFVEVDLSQDTGLDLEVRSAFDPAGRPIDYLKKRVKDLDTGTPIEVKLERGLVVSGRIVDGAGAGLANIQLRIAKKGSNNYNWTGRSVTKSSEDGSWRLAGLQEGEYTISVTPGGDWMNPEHTPCEAGDKDIVIKLARGLAIAGVVFDPNGEPLAAADVWLNETPGSRKRRGVDKGPRDWTAQYRFRSKTGANGQFLIRGLPEDGLFHVGANGSGPDGAYTSETLNDVSPGTKNLQIHLGEAATIEGAVWGPDGEPITSGSVRANPLAKGPGQTSRSTNLRNGSNTFKLGPLKPGRYKLTFHPRGQKYSAPEPLEVDAPSSGNRFDLREALVVEGHLQGERIQGFSVNFVSGSSSTGVRVASDGSFKIKTTAGKVGSLFARKKGDTRYAWLGEVEAGTGQVYTLQLGEGLAISGFIEDLPYEWKGCNVYARGYGNWIHGNVQRDGSFQITGLPPGTFTVQAWLNGGRIAPVHKIEAGAQEVILRYVPNQPR